MGCNTATDKEEMT